jgi:hypothetical protein
MNELERARQCNSAKRREVEVPCTEEPLVSDSTHEWHKHIIQCRVYSRWVDDCDDCSFNVNADPDE